MALDRIGPRKPVVVGCVAVALSMVGFWQLRIGAPLAAVEGLMVLALQFPNHVESRTSGAASQPDVRHAHLVAGETAAAAAD